MIRHFNNKELTPEAINGILFIWFCLLTSIHTVSAIWLVIECRHAYSLWIDISHKNHHGFPHFLYTGAVMSMGYPAGRIVPTIYNPSKTYYKMLFGGGLPPHTYTTIRLHSPPSLLSKMYLAMKVKPSKWYVILIIVMVVTAWVPKASSQWGGC